MGFFSWITSDTKRSISNVHSSRGSFPVYLITPNGQAIREDHYDGYGRFGGYDAYALLAQWNCPKKCKGDPEEDRYLGIDLAFDEENKAKFPLKFAEDPSRSYESLKPSEICKEQGFFYDDDDNLF